MRQTQTTRSRNCVHGLHADAHPRCWSLHPRSAGTLLQRGRTLLRHRCSDTAAPTPFRAYLSLSRRDLSALVLCAPLAAHASRHRT